ncbi:MAG: GntR family transcriptional regulator [Alphaproteobacteria bacterium]|nr:GntR family transcriptional regulator [Alphaproteobacteria bacterium]
MSASPSLVVRQSLPQAVAERLRGLIVEGGLAPGERLNERELCERLGVSRTPLREAFRLLSGDGLLRQEPNRGVQVVALGADEARDTFDLMAALEGEAAARAAERATPDDLAALHQLQESMESAHRRGDLAAYYRTNREIHARFASIAANAVLARTMELLNGRLHALRFRSNLRPAKWDRAVDEHRRMLEALAARDGDGLRRLMVGHLHAKRDTVLADLNNEP